MSTLGVARTDKYLIAHLSHGGDIDDPVSGGLIAELIRESLDIKSIGRIVRHHGLSNELLANIYRSSFEASLPDPLIRWGTAPLLASSLIFIDQNYLPRVLDHWVAATYEIEDGDSRDLVILEGAVMLTVGLRDNAKKEGRMESWPVRSSPTLEDMQRLKRSGCVGLVCISGSLGFAALAGLNYIIS